MKEKKEISLCLEIYRVYREKRSILYEMIVSL